MLRQTTSTYFHSISCLKKINWNLENSWNSLKNIFSTENDWSSIKFCFDAIEKDYFFYNFHIQYTKIGKKFILFYYFIAFIFQIIKFIEKKYNKLSLIFYIIIWIRIIFDISKIRKLTDESRDNYEQYFPLQKPFTTLLKPDY